MAEEYPSQQLGLDIGTQLRDFEEKQRLLKDRIILISQSLIEERERNFKEIQELKREFIKFKEENLRMKEFLQRVAEQLSNTSRKEELMIIQKQLDLLRKKE
jgi:hypothetical protein